MSLVTIQKHLVTRFLLHADRQNLSIFLFSLVWLLVATLSLPFDGNEKSDTPISTVSD